MAATVDNVMASINETNKEIKKISTQLMAVQKEIGFEMATIPKREQ